MRLPCARSLFRMGHSKGGGSISNDCVHPEACCFGLFALVGDRLVGGADAGIEDRLHVEHRPLMWRPHINPPVDQSQPMRKGRTSERETRNKKPAEAGRVAYGAPAG